jgi:hypothetical protein
LRVFSWPPKATPKGFFTKGKPGENGGYTVITIKSYSFGEFTISGNTLIAKIVNNPGATIDTFMIIKQRHTIPGIGY